MLAFGAYTIAKLCFLFIAFLEGEYDCATQWHSPCPRWKGELYTASNSLYFQRKTNERHARTMSRRTRGERPIGHFEVHLSLHFKARLRAKFLLWKSVFMHIEIGTNYHMHNNNFALSLALKERLRGTRKWPIFCAPFAWRVVRLMCDACSSREIYIFSSQLLTTCSRRELQNILKACM